MSTMSLVLILHISLSIIVFGGFLARYAVAFKNKSYPSKGRWLMMALSGLLIYSGVLLASIGKLPLSSICLSALGLIVALIGLEIGLQKFSNVLFSRAAEVRSTEDDK